MLHPVGTKPGPQPDSYSKGVPDISVAFIDAEPKSSKTHRALCMVNKIANASRDHMHRRIYAFLSYVEA